jgi:hypothetical protein
MIFWLGGRPTAGIVIGPPVGAVQRRTLPTKRRFSNGSDIRHDAANRPSSG